MATVYLLTNDGSGEDGDEWLLNSIYATRESAEAAKTEWYRSVEEWEIEGSLLTDEEREAIRVAAEVIEDKYHGTSCENELKALATLRGLLARCATSTT